MASVDEITLSSDDEEPVASSGVPKSDEEKFLELIAKHNIDVEEYMREAFEKLGIEEKHKQIVADLTRSINRVTSDLEDIGEMADEVDNIISLYGKPQEM